MLKFISSSAIALCLALATTTAAQADHKHHNREALVGLIGLTAGIIIGKGIADDDNHHHADHDEWPEADEEEDEVVITSHKHKPKKCIPDGWGGVFHKVKHKNGSYWAKVPGGVNNGRTWEIYDHCEPATCGNNNGYICTGMQGYK